MVRDDEVAGIEPVDGLGVGDRSLSTGPKASAPTISVVVNAPEQSANYRRWSYVVNLLLEQIGLTVRVRPGASAGDAGAVEHSDIAASISPGIDLTREQIDEYFAIATLKREIDSGLLDPAGRFDEDKSRWRTDRPTLWDAACGIRQKLADSGVRLPERLPRFRVIFTHDIDRMTEMEPVNIFKWVLQSLRLRQAPFMNHHPFAPNRILRLVEQLLALEEEMGVQSWTFCLSGPYSLRHCGSRYDSGWPSAQRIFKCIQRHSGRLGLHGSYWAREGNSYDFERRRLEKTCHQALTAHRNHYLRFDPLRVWSQLEQAGLSIDMSVGFTKHIGYRTGLCHAYRPYDLLSDRVSNVVEIPLLFMESHHNVDLDLTLDYLAEQMSFLRNAGGCVSILLHPDKMVGDAELWLSFYSRLLRHARNLGADISGEIPKIGGNSAICLA